MACTSYFNTWNSAYKPIATFGKGALSSKECEFPDREICILIIDNWDEKGRICYNCKEM
jgi:hypothetical protein